MCAGSPFTEALEGLLEKSMLCAVTSILKARGNQINTAAVV